MTGATAAAAPVPGPAAHHPPRLLAVLREQIGAVGGSLRREFFAVALLMAGVTVLLGLDYVTQRSAIHFDLAAMAIPAAIVGLLAPVAVWKREEPSRRAYHWSMPVDRARHTLIKAFCGWVWLMALVAVYLLWAVAIPLVTGGDIGIDVIRKPLLETLPEGTRILDMSLHRHPWMWLVPFGGATVAYLFASILTFATDRPWLWGAGIWFAWMVPAARFDEAGDAWLAWFDAIAFGQYGALTVLAALTTIDDPSGAPDVDLGLVAGTTWVSATLLWLALGLAGATIAAYWHQER